jgi:hypothetical protein
MTTEKKIFERTVCECAPNLVRLPFVILLPRAKAQPPSGWVSYAGRKNVPCTNRANMSGIQATWVNFERKADSPNCWKQ